MHDFLISHSIPNGILFFARRNSLLTEALLTKTNQTKIDFGLLDVYCYFMVNFKTIVSCQSSSFLIIMGGFLKYIHWRISSHLISSCNRSFTHTYSNLEISEL